MEFVDAIRHLSPDELKRIIKTDDEFPLSDNVESNIYTVADMLEEYGADPKVENNRKAILDFFIVEEDKKTFHDEIREKAMTDRQKAIEKLERQRAKIESELFKLRQEEKEWEEQYNNANKDNSWEMYYENNNNENKEEMKHGGEITFYEDKIDQRMKMLYEKPFSTEIPFFDFTDSEKEKIGPKLKEWFEKVIKQYMGKKILVVYVINGEIKRFPIQEELKRLENMFSGDYTFHVEHMPSGIKSGDDTPLYISFIDNMWFEFYNENTKCESSLRSVHNDGFFPRKLSGLYKHMAPFLRKYQIYDTYLDEKKNVKPDCLMPCFIHCLEQKGFSEELIDDVMGFIGYSRTVSRNDFSTIADMFGIRIHLRIFNENKGWIDNGNQNTNGWYGPTDGKEIYLAEYLNHVFIDEELPINLYAIRHWTEVWAYCSKHGWDVSKMLKVYTFINGIAKTNTKKAHARSLDVIVAIHQSGGFEEINAKDEDVEKANIFLYHMLTPDPEPRIVKQAFETRRIEMKSLGQELEGDVFYGDFETCKKKVTGVKNVSHEAIPFMLCIQDRYGKVKRTYIGKKCVEQFLHEVPDKALVYFHNFGFDGNFFMKYGKGTVIKKGSKNMSMEVRYENKTISFRDSYSMFSKALKQFPAAFPDAFKGTDIKKEVFPYDYYTYERIYGTFNTGNINDAIKEGHLSPTDAQQFRENIKMTNSEIDDEHFDMIKYCDFYCTQDVNVLRVGFNAFRDAALNDPIRLDVFDFLTLPALANAYMQRQVFMPNGNIYELSGNVQQYIQKCVYGGRCMTANNKRYIVKDKLDDFDACSLYPSAMNRMFTVEGIPEYYEHTSDEVYNKDHLPDILIHAFDEDQTEPTKDKYISQFFVDIHITNVGIKRSFPLIVKRETNKQTNCNECVDMTVDMLTLQDLIRFHDISFTMSDGYVMKGRRDHRIRNEIQKLFNLRAEYKKNKNPTQEIIKLIMNSAYGKTIQKPIKSYLQFVSENDYHKFVIDRYQQIIRIDDVEEKGLKLCELKKRLSRQFNNVVFGVTVLSMSKRIMNEVMTLAEDLDINIYYQDTDSMHIDHDKVPLLDQEFEKLYGRKLIGENKMGCFHNDFDELKDAYATLHISLGKKMYYDKLENDEGKTAEHYRLKGIPQDAIRRTADKYFNGSVQKLYMFLFEGNELAFDLLDGRVSFKFLRSGQVQYIDNFKRNVKATSEK